VDAVGYGSHFLATEFMGPSSFACNWFKVGVVLMFTRQCQEIGYSMTELRKKLINKLEKLPGIDVHYGSLILNSW
jgi:hypothetical protein